MRKKQTPEQKADMIRIGNRLSEVRREAGLSLSDVADRLNRDFGANTNKGMISKYENGIHEPAAGTIYCFSCIYGVSTDYIIGRSDVKTSPEPEQGCEVSGYCVKLFSSMSDRDKGVQDYRKSIIIPKKWLVGGREFFAYIICGGRLAPRYYDGDVVIFERKIKAKKDQVCLVSVEGGDAVLCTVVRKREGKQIKPLDPALEGRFYSTEEIAKLPVKILGVAVELRRLEPED